MKTELTRDQWTAEVCRLLVEKYALKWKPEEIQEYAQGIAANSWEDGEPWDTPDAAIQEEFAAGM